MTNVGQTQLGANILRVEFQIKEKEKRSQKEKTELAAGMYAPFIGLPKLAQVLKEMDRYRIDITRISSLKQD